MRFITGMRLPASVIVLVAAAGAGATTAGRAVRGRVEYTEGAAVLGVDAASPRFSFEAVGGSDRGEAIAKHQITVSRLAADGPPVSVWDSGPTAANSSCQITPPASVTFAPDSR